MYGYNVILCCRFFDLYKFCEKNVLKLNFGTVHRLIRPRLTAGYKSFKTFPQSLVPTTICTYLEMTLDSTLYVQKHPRSLPPPSSGQAEFLTTDAKVAHLAPDRNWLPGPSAVASLEQAERAFNSPLSCHLV